MQCVGRMRRRVSPLTSGLVMWGVVTSGLFVIRAVHAADAPTQSVTTAAPGDAARGRELFKNYGCFSCHGTEGQGASTGAKLAPGPLPLQAFLVLVRHPANVMPPYSEKVLSEHDLRDIHAFLASVTAPNPQALTSARAKAK